LGETSAREEGPNRLRGGRFRREAKSWKECLLEQIPRGEIKREFEYKWAYSS
jgi:hypothetical protein